VARKDAQVQTMSDLFTKELLVGAAGTGTATYPEFELGQYVSARNGCI
jgi:TRAP-type uncharacterized transport system substrate-binding protein